MWKDKAYIVCNNCGKYGHIFNECRYPITSHGIILYRDGVGGEEREYLMIRRKDSFGYIDFMRGKYNVNNSMQIKMLIDEMNKEEKDGLLTQNFHNLWNKLWIYSSNKDNFNSEETKSKYKFDLIKNNLPEWINQQNQTVWEETEWEFPKGKRNINEKDFECSVREFEEETGISRNHIDLLENVLPFEEHFIGSNGKTYKNKYYVARIKHEYQNNINLLGFQKSEVSKMEWKSYSNCLSSIRNYHLEKKRVLFNINTLLNEMKIIRPPHYSFSFVKHTSNSNMGDKFDTFSRS